MKDFYIILYQFVGGGIFFYLHETENITIVAVSFLLGTAFLVFILTFALLTKIMEKRYAI